MLTLLVLIEKIYLDLIAMCLLYVNHVMINETLFDIIEIIVIYPFFKIEIVRLKLGGT